MVMVLQCLFLLTPLEASRMVNVLVAALYISVLSVCLLVHCLYLSPRCMLRCSCLGPFDVWMDVCFFQISSLLLRVAAASLLGVLGSISTQFYAKCLLEFRSFYQTPHHLVCCYIYIKVSLMFLICTFEWREESALSWTCATVLYLSHYFNPDTCW